ncbi:hypothetical protein ACFYOR_34915 [Streptomyces griseofuscus]|uniref:hypothetical protein n=1 Tax=Streptomyces griseofuscus TaxID=146922 RepID=UPI00367B016A
MARYFNFLYFSRGGRDWRQATEDDHLAFHHWRRRDESGPTVQGSTWSQEVSHVNQFYQWAVGRQLVAEVPIPQRDRRTPPPGSSFAPSRAGAAGTATVPATYAHDEAGERIEWLPAASYRRWRDVGVRGYDVAGLPRPRFRGRWTSRNATYSDLMVRTGMRISEQSAVTDIKLPTGPGPAGFRRFWLPEAIAKGRSARWVYAPGSVVRDLTDYRDVDRAEVIADAQARVGTSPNRDLQARCGRLWTQPAGLPVRLVRHAQRPLRQGHKGQPPRRRNVLSVMDWAVEAVADYVENVRPRFGFPDLFVSTSLGTSAPAFHGSMTYEVDLAPPV